MSQAHSKEVGAGGDPSQVQDTVEERWETVKKCDVTSMFDTSSLIHESASATKVSVGVFVINIEHGRRRQKWAASGGEAGVFFADFLIFLRKPSGSDLWTDDSAVWNTISFRNAKDIYFSQNLPVVAGVRHVQGAFYYDPNLDMYPLDSQSLKIIVQQTKETADKWVFVPDDNLNGLSGGMEDISHKKCSGDAVFSSVDGKEYSALSFSVVVRKPRRYAVVTAFIPPVLIMLPVMLSYSLGPMSWYPLRFLLAGCSFVMMAFFYDSFLRQLPILAYLTLFDKYIYCLYLWLIGGIVSLLMMVLIFRDVAAEREAEKHREGLMDETPLYLSVALRDDLLFLSMFCAILTLVALFALFVAWVLLPDVVMLFIFILVIWIYMWWLHMSYHRLKRKHGLEQSEQGGLSKVMTREDVELAKGRAFNCELLLCCCYPPIVNICIEECCCCCGAGRNADDQVRHSCL